MGDRAASEEFDEVVRHLAQDASWRRCVRRARIAHGVDRVRRHLWTGLGDIGCWFCAVPPQRANRSVVAGGRG